MVELQFVVLAVAGSSPVDHPTFVQVGGTKPNHPPRQSGSLPPALLSLRPTITSSSPKHMFGPNTQEPTRISRRLHLRSIRDASNTHSTQTAQTSRYYGPYKNFLGLDKSKAQRMRSTPFPGWPPGIALLASQAPSTPQVLPLIKLPHLQETSPDTFAFSRRPKKTNR